MRAALLVVAGVAGLCLAAGALAQTVEQPAGLVSAPAKHAKGAHGRVKKKVAVHVDAKGAAHPKVKRKGPVKIDAAAPGLGASPTAGGAPTASLRNSPAKPASGPVSLDMKWNGNNDDARTTRIQNYNGGAEGTGAQVGLKLHF